MLRASFAHAAVCSARAPLPADGARSWAGRDEIQPRSDTCGRSSGHRREPSRTPPSATQRPSCGTDRATSFGHPAPHGAAARRVDCPAGAGRHARAEWLERRHLHLLLHRGEPRIPLRFSEVAMCYGDGVLPRDVVERYADGTRQMAISTYYYELVREDAGAAGRRCRSTKCTTTTAVC